MGDGLVQLLITLEQRESRPHPSVDIPPIMLTTQALLLFLYLPAQTPTIGDTSDAVLNTMIATPHFKFGCACSCKALS